MKNLKLNRDRTSGFTLMEMLVVVGVLAILMGLLAPAILKTFKVASSKKTLMEAQSLQSAIVEYWHDQGSWPLPKGTGITRSGEKLNYTVTFRENNDEVFNLLLDVNYGGSKKNYIETAEHLTTASPASKFPAYDAATLKQVVEGIEGINHRTDNRPLVYWAEVKVEGTDGTEQALQPFKVTFDLLNNKVSVRP